MKCNHRLPDNLHCPTFFSQLSASVAFPSSLKTPYIHTHVLQKKCSSFCSRANKTAPFLGYVHMNIYLNVNSINLSFSLLTSRQPAADTFVVLLIFVKHVWFCRTSKRSFYKEPFSLHLYIFLMTASLSLISNASRLVQKLPYHKRQNTNSRKTKKEKEQWQRKNLLNQNSFSVFITTNSFNLAPIASSCLFSRQKWTTAN